MASPDVLDFEALLKPVSDGAPTGTDVRQDISPTSPYYRIKDARAAARAAERQAEMEDDPDAWSRVDWRPVLELAPKILGSASKDLEVVAWGIEALVRLRGFPGLRDGFRLARELVERYWDGLYPFPDEDGVATRVAPLVGLNGEGAPGTLVTPIQRVAITADTPVGTFAAWHFQQARDLDRIEDEKLRAQRLEHGAVTSETFQAAVLQTPPEFFRSLVEDLDACLAEYAALSKALDERCGADSPPTSNVLNALQSVLDTVRFVAKDSLAFDAPQEAHAEASASDNAAPSPSAPAAAPGELRTRDDALRAIKRAADFIRKTEPHSPLPFVLEQAVRWGHMSLPELLQELIPDQNARKQLFQLTGMPTEKT